MIGPILFGCAFGAWFVGRPTGFFYVRPWLAIIVGAFIISGTIAMTFGAP